MRRGHGRVGVGGRGSCARVPHPCDEAATKHQKLLSVSAAAAEKSSGRFTVFGKCSFSTLSNRTHTLKHKKERKTQRGARSRLPRAGHPSRLQAASCGLHAPRPHTPHTAHRTPHTAHRTPWPQKPPTHRARPPPCAVPSSAAVGRQCGPPATRHRRPSAAAVRPSWARRSCFG